MAARFDAYLFDAGGVLVLPDPTVLSPLLAYFGGDVEIDAHRRAHYWAMAHKSWNGDSETDWSIYDDEYVASVGVPPERRTEAAAVLRHVKGHFIWRWPIPEHRAPLVELESRGTPLGVVSNAFGQIEALMNHTRICQVGPGPGVNMRCIIDSHVVGVAKPDPQIFEHALAFFPEFERSRVAYVGDSVTMDVEGARAAGLHPILVDPYDDHLGADFERIRSLSDLL